MGEEERTEAWLGSTWNPGEEAAGQGKLAAEWEDRLRGLLRTQNLQLPTYILIPPPVSFSFRVLPLYLTKCCFCHRLLLSARQCDRGGQVLQFGREIIHGEFVWTRKGGQAAGKGAQGEGTQRGGADGGPSHLLWDFPINVGNAKALWCKAGTEPLSSFHLQPIHPHMSSQPLPLNQTPT